MTSLHFFVPSVITLLHLVLINNMTDVTGAKTSKPVVVKYDSESLTASQFDRLGRRDVALARGRKYKYNGVSRKTLKGRIRDDTIITLREKHVVWEKVEDLHEKSRSCNYLLGRIKGRINVESDLIGKKVMMKRKEVPEANGAFYIVVFPDVECTTFYAYQFTDQHFLISSDIKEVGSAVNMMTRMNTIDEGCVPNMLSRNTRATTYMVTLS